MGSLVGLDGYIIPVKLITYLVEKRVHPNLSVRGINEVNIYQFDPSDLPALSGTNSDALVWYFFIEPYYKNAKSERSHRATRGGNWKITGQRRDVKDEGKVVGSKKTLVFCRRGRTSKGIETEWVMHEFYVKDSPRFKKNFVVCYIEKKRRKKSSVSTADVGQPSPSLSSDYVSHITENPSSEFLVQVESQQLQLMSQQMISDSGRHISESSFLQEEPPLPSSNNLASEPINPSPEFSSEVEPQLLSSPELDYDPIIHFIASSSSMIYQQLLAQFEEISYYNWLNQSLDPALQSPNNPHQRSNSSYGISNTCNMRSYQCTGGLEDVVNSRRNVQN